MSRLLGLDYGDTRIGIALTDPLKITASGYATIQNNKDCYQAIYEICKEKQVEAIIAGIPFDQHNGIGEAAKKVLYFIKRLIKYFKEHDLEIKIYEQDERYSTVEAISTMKKIKVKNKKRQQVVDQIAAANILKNFMTSKYKTILDLERYLNNINQ